MNSKTSIFSVPPSLFSFAPKELSQDAFLCWLISWAQDGQQGELAALINMSWLESQRA